MKLFIIIPCLNEEKTIGDVINNIPASIKGINSIKIVVIDDGSTDSTASIARQNNAFVISHSFTKGVGAAFHTGIEYSISAGADIVVNIDGDGQFNPEFIPDLINPILEKKVDCTTASRFKDKALIPRMPFLKKWGNIQMARLISFLVSKKFYDVSCGFRAYSTETILKMNLFGQFTYTQETFLDIVFKGLRIGEVPIKIKGEREFGKSRVASSLTKYAVNTLKIIFRTFRDYKPLKFFSFIAVALFLVSFVLGTLFFYHYTQTGQFTGQLWAGFSSGFLLLFGFLFFLTGLLGDMLVRIRSNQEKLLYIEKRKVWNKARSSDNHEKE